MPLKFNWRRPQTSGQFLLCSATEPLEDQWSGPRVSPAACRRRVEGSASSARQVHTQSTKQPRRGDPSRSLPRSASMGDKKEGAESAILHLSRPSGPDSEYPSRESWRAHTASVPPADVRSDSIGSLAVVEVPKKHEEIPIDSPLWRAIKISSLRLRTRPVSCVPVGTGWRSGEDSPRAGESVSIISAASNGQTSFRSLLVHQSKHHNVLGCHDEHQGNKTP